MFAFLLVVCGVALGGMAAALAFMLLRKGAAKAPTQITTHTIAERVRSVGKLVGLEVTAKEIATSVKGWSWLPPLLLTPARVAMIFHFEKQYTVDLTRVGPTDVEDAGRTPTGAPRYRLRLPPIEGSLRLVDLEPYDIQAGRALGLLDVIQMDATTQKDLIRRAQDQASSLYQSNDARYEREARASVERHLSALLSLFGVEVEVTWSAPAPPSRAGATDSPEAAPIGVPSWGARAVGSARGIV